MSNQPQKQALECEACGDVTLHENFLHGVPGDGALWACLSCLSHWKPRTTKPARLYVCEGCDTKQLVFERNGEIVARPVAACFRPDRSLVEVVSVRCSRCIEEV